MPTPNIEMTGEWAEHYKKIAEEFDIALVIGRAIMAGEDIKTISSRIIGENSFFFSRNRMMVRSFDANHYEIILTTGGRTMKPYANEEEKMWLNFLAIEQYEKFLISQELEILQTKYKDLIEVEKLRQSLLDEVHANRKQIDKNAEQHAQMLMGDQPKKE